MSKEVSDKDSNLGVNLTPKEIVSELDRYVIAQDKAKKAVAIALRNRWRRLKVPDEIREEITPKNIIMIGPTGVGKTEISRRLAKLSNAPFVKVEASKFTEVGYIGRDVESIVRDLVEVSYHQVREKERVNVLAKAKQVAEEKLLDLLLPGSSDSKQLSPDSEECELDEIEDIQGEFIFEKGSEQEEDHSFFDPNAGVILQDEGGVGYIGKDSENVKSTSSDQSSSTDRTREKLRKLLQEGKLEDRVVEFDTHKQVSTHMQILGPQGMGEIEGQIKDMFSSMIPKQRETKKLPIKEARKILVQESQESLIDEESVAELALKQAAECGIVFIDEIDKICASVGGKGPDVSREGVQRDLLPLVEGCTVGTKYGQLKTDHILFIASGAFHIARPSDLMPEFQGRFPIRVELTSLTPDHFVRILTEPENALVKQYKALMQTEGVKLSFTEDAIKEIANLTADVNAKTENIGARRLHTLLERLLEDLSFDANEKRGQSIEIDRAFVSSKLSEIVEDNDLARFIL